MFSGRHFNRSVILLCVRWYLAYNLSLRDLEEMMAERGIRVDHSTIHRWVIRFSPLLLEQFNHRKRAVTGKWHIDEGFGVAGDIYTAPSTASVTRSNSSSASIVTGWPPSASSARL
jgi:transposase-like protein